MESLRLVSEASCECGCVFLGVAVVVAAAMAAAYYYSGNQILKSKSSLHSSALMFCKS